APTNRSSISCSPTRATSISSGGWPSGSASTTTIDLTAPLPAKRRTKPCERSYSKRGSCLTRSATSHRNMTPVLLTVGDALAVLGVVLGTQTVTYGGVPQNVGIAIIGDELVNLPSRMLGGELAARLGLSGASLQRSA